jgi:hypothetical protein
MPSDPANSPGEIPGEVVHRWRTAENQLYPVVMTRPDLYEHAIQLVRAVADELRSCATPAALVAAYASAVELVADVIRRQDLVVEGLDLGLATDAAFSLRHREVLDESAREQAMERVQAARERGDEWVLLHESGTLAQAPAVPYRRLEMRVRDGAGLHVFVQQDPATAGPLYGVEAVQLDPHTGDWLAEAAAWAPAETFTQPEPWRRLVEELHGYGHDP